MYPFAVGFSEYPANEATLLILSLHRATPPYSIESRERSNHIRAIGEGTVDVPCCILRGANGVSTESQLETLSKSAGYGEDV
jgi:hypothetical protein